MQREWVEVNSERVQRMRDLAIANQLENSTKRKEEWDKQAQFRQFEKGDKVHILEEEWTEHEIRGKLGRAI